MRTKYPIFKFGRLYLLTTLCLAMSLASLDILAQPVSGDPAANTRAFAPAPAVPQGIQALAPAVGSFQVSDGPSWTDDIPTYSCVESCALVFGGEPDDYHCSTISDSINNLAWASSWGSPLHCEDGGGVPIAEDFKQGTHTDCDEDFCYISTYVGDHCGFDGQGTSENFCFAADSLSKELTSGPDRDGSLWYEDFADVSGLTLNGSAAQAGSALRLTPASQNQAGSAFTSNPLTLGPDGSFNTQFSFQITDSGGGGADGIAFVIHNDAAADTALGGTGGRLGYSGITPSLAVEFDTWYNFTLGDPNANHVGTGINGAVGSGAAVQLAGPALDGGTVFYAWVDYDGVADMLEVRVASVNVRPAAPNLSQGGIGLVANLGGTTAYVGFTSATGSAYNNHAILSWHFSSAIDLVVPIGVLVPTEYDFTITWSGNTPVWVYDRVPAEWDVTDIEFDDTGLPLDCAGETTFVGPYGTVEVYRGGKPGKTCQSDTGFRWMPGDDNTLNVQTKARCHDTKNNKKCKPTSCGALYLNYGAIAFEKDEFGDLVYDDNGDPIVAAGPTNPLCLAAVDDVNGDGIFTWDGSGDEDSDGLADYEEACGVGTNPCDDDSDGDGILDGRDECPLEGPADPALGEILEPNGCIRHSQCSDGIDNDGDTFVDFPDDAGCDDILDDIEEGACVEAFDCSDPDAQLVECGNGGDCACFQNVDGPSVCVDSTTLCAGLTECINGSDCALDEACVPASCCGVQVCVNATICNDPALTEAVNFSFEGQGPTLGRQ